MGLTGFLLSNKMKAEIATAVKQERLVFLGPDSVSYVDLSGRKCEFTMSKLAKHLADKFAKGIELANQRAGTSVHSNVSEDDIKAMLLKEYQGQQRRDKV